MKKSVLAFLSSVMALVIVSTTMTLPSQAADRDVACSEGGGSFKIQGTTVVSSTLGCEGAVVIPADVTVITSGAFEYRNKLMSVAFEQGSQLQSIWPSAFRRAGVTSIDLPDGLTSISAGAFEETATKSISIPGTVTHIGTEIFIYGVLEDVTFEPRTATTLNLSAKAFNRAKFSGTLVFKGPGPTLTVSPEIPAKAGFISDGWSTSPQGPKVSFPFVTGSADSALYARYIADVVTTHNCGTAGTFEVRNGITGNPTANCAGDIIIPASATTVQGFGGTKIANVTFESGSLAKSLGEYAFQDSTLRSIDLPDGLETIGRLSLASTQLTSLSIPGSVKSIHGEGIADNLRLETLFFESRLAGAGTLGVGGYGGNRKLKSLTFMGATQLSGSPTVVKPVNTWLGWSTSEGGPIVAFPSSVGEAGLTLFTNHSPKTYTVTFDSKLGSEVAPSSIVGGEIQFPTPPTRAGYDLWKWVRNANDPGPAADPGVVNWYSESDLSLEAMWIARTYVVNLNMKGGQPKDPGFYKTDDFVWFSAGNPIRPGWNFNGWSATDGGPLLPGGYYYPRLTQDITLYANWTPNSFWVNWERNGGSYVQRVAFLADGQVQSAPVPTQVGYRFDGWAATPSGPVVSFPYAPAVYRDVTLYSQWTKQYQVTYNNVGTAFASSWFDQFGSIFTEPVAPVRAGYRFDGWSATQNGALITFPYTPGVSSNITLHAKWTRQFEVAYKNMGTDFAGSLFDEFGSIFTEPLAPVRAGYDFDGWSETDGGEVVSLPYTPGVSSNITLHAKWTAKTYSVNLDTKGGLPVPAVSFVTDGDVSEAPTTPIRPGYTFDGWSFTENGAFVSFPYSPGVIEDITLYAKWTRNPFKPELIAGDVIAGTGIQSTLLSAAGGSWLAYPEAVVLRQWYRCSSAVAAGLQALPSASKCVKITGATAANYKVAVADAGKYLTSLVEAKNSIGTTFLTVASFRAPSLKKPSRVALPVGTGTAKASSYLTGTLGTWEGNPVPKTTVQWFRCEKATAAASSAVPRSAQCDAIPGAKSTQYRLGTADKGKYVTVQITAKNTEGEAVTTAKSQRVLLDPTLVDNPEISGAATLNRSLSANKGTWLAYPTATTSLQWYRCNRATSPGAKSFSGSSGCKAIAGATRSSYRTGAADEGKYISVLVTATNSAGTKSVTTRSTDKIEDPNQSNQ